MRSREGEALGMPVNRLRRRWSNALVAREARRSKTLRQPGVFDRPRHTPEQVAAAVAGLGGSPALFLDFDGTLVDIAPRPSAVVVPKGLIELLVRLQERFDEAVAVLSGRTLDVVDLFLAPLRLPGGGQHGLELRDHDGTRRVIATATAIDAVRPRVAELARALPGTETEHKPLTVAVHYRARPDVESDLLPALLALVGRDPRLELRAGKCVLEIATGGASKGSALAALMAAPPFAGRRPVVFGDDLTDEAAFDAAHALGGIAVQVGERPTAHADLTLPSPADVRATLRLLADTEASTHAVA